MISTSGSFSFSSEGLLPQEEMLELGRRKRKVTIGIPKENDKFESRVPLTPEAVELLVRAGHEVIIESGAGVRANFSDLQYSECGGFISQNIKEVFQSELILKIAPLTEYESDYLNSYQSIFSALNISTQNSVRIRKLMERKANALAFEHIRDSNHFRPVVRAMSEIAGSSAVLIAAEYLSNMHNGKGILLGGITGVTPTEVVIIGAGTAGEYAARTALGLGAMVKIFDNSLYRLHQMQNLLGQRVYTSVLHQHVLSRSLASADVVIGALSFESNPEFLVGEEDVQLMKPGSVIVDISIDNNPCFETSRLTNHGNPTFVKHGVLHYCVPNIASRVAKTASIALSNIFVPILLRLGACGGMRQLLKEDIGLRKGVYVYNGILTNSRLGNMFNIPAKNIDLLMAAF